MSFSSQLKLMDKANLLKSEVIKEEPASIFSIFQTKLQKVFSNIE